MGFNSTRGSQDVGSVLLLKNRHQSYVMGMCYSAKKRFSFMELTLTATPAKNEREKICEIKNFANLVSK